ncbi:MAG: hypothetical protein WCG44_02945 [bacterium]
MDKDIDKDAIALAEAQSKIIESGKGKIAASSRVAKALFLNEKLSYADQILWAFGIKRKQSTPPTNPPQEK